MKIKILFICIFSGTFMLCPAYSFAQSCSVGETTIVFVNGMFGEGSMEGDNTALRYSKLLAKEMPNTGSNYTFDHAFNPSHFGGLGDEIKVIQQSMISANQIEDHDFHTMVRGLHERVKTSKVVLVGHSQGTFYTNALRNYFVAHGMPPESVGVFNIATPAEYVSGGNPENNYKDNYLTSGSDNLVIWAREFQKNFTARALPATHGVFLPYAKDEDSSGIFAGHNFEHVYMEYAADKIIAGILKTAGDLQSGPVRIKPCLPQDDQSDVLFYLKNSLYKTGDETVRSVKEVPSVAKNLPVETQATIAAVSGAVYQAVYVPTLRLGERVMVAVGNTIISTTALAYNASKNLVLYPIRLVASSVLFSSPPQMQSSTAFAAVNVPEIIPVPEISRPVQSEPIPILAESEAQVPILPKQTSEILWQYIPEHDASYIPAPAIPPLHVVSAPVTGAAPGGTDTPIPPPSPQPIILTGGAGQGGGGAPAPEPISGVAAPLSCVLPDILNAAGDACIPKTCTAPEVLDATYACTIPLDTTPPALTITLTGCLAETRVDATTTCLIHTASTPTLAWSTDTDSVIQLNTVTTTDTSATLTGNTTLTATDVAGNSTTHTITLTQESSPLRISEVGYPMSSHLLPPNALLNYQYIELYNTTTTPLDLASLMLQSSSRTHDGTPQFSLLLSGTIQPHSYYLITNAFDIQGVTEDVTTAWTQVLPNTGSEAHQLLLVQGAATLDSFELGCPALTSTCHISGHPFALERSARRGNAIAYAYADEQNNPTFVFTADTKQFVGSPGKRNTADFVLSTLTGTLTPTFNPYYGRSVVVPVGETATIEPGVTLTMSDGGGFGVLGALTASGTAEAPIVISSADRWHGMSVAATGVLTMSNATITNAGIGNSGSDRAALKNEGGSITLTDVTLQEVRPNGFFQESGTTSFTNVSMSNTTTIPENMLKLRGGSLTYTGGTLTNAIDFGFHITGTPTCTITNVTMTGVRYARTTGSDALCAWSGMVHEGGAL